MQHKTTDSDKINSNKHLTKNSTSKYRFIAIIILILLSFGVIYPWIYSKFYIHVSNAYISTEVLPILSQSMGIVKFVGVEQDQYINPEDLLIELETAVYQQQLHNAKFELLVATEKLRLAEFKQSRAIELLKIKAITHKEYQDIMEITIAAKEAVEKVQTEISELNTNIANARIIAKTSGWITKVPIKPGDKILNNQTLLHMVTPENFWIKLNLTKQQLAQLDPTQQVEIKIKDFPEHVLSGKIYLNLKNNQENTVSKPTQKLNNPIIVLIKNEFNLPLRNGMQAKVLIRIDKKLEYLKYISQIYSSKT